MEHKVRLYNTLSREVEDFIPVDDGNVRIYACGPTVYDFAHIGHIRKYMFDDILVRLLRYLNYNVTHVMNITDVGHLTSNADTGEDKMEKGARREGKTAWEIAKFYEDYFFKSMAQVNTRRPDIVCRATEHIQEQIELISRLEAKGLTYKIPDGVYFDSTKFPDYGKLAGFNPEKQAAGARVEPVWGKKHATDFALWKLTPAQEKRQMEWDSPWGKGFPGWHIECSAMSLKYLGNAYSDSGKLQAEASRTIDIHTGGIDHIPIHHTNEIAQSEGATGKQFVKYWIHHNFLTVEGEKMSKSLHNFLTIDEVVKHGFDPLALRYLFLQTHYRQESNFTWNALTAAQNALNQLRTTLLVIRSQTKESERTMLSSEKLKRTDELRRRFKDVIRLDLNTPQALAVLWEILKSNIPAGDKYDVVMIADEILGLGLQHLLETEPQTVAVPQEIMLLMSKRTSLRSAGKYSEADKVRVQIEEKGFVVIDTPEGSTMRKK